MSETRFPTNFKKMRKIKFENNYYYHIYNRGVEKRIIFLDDEDRLRFVYYLYELNNEELLKDEAFSRRKKTLFVGNSVSDKKKLVNIVCFSLMPNHFHILLRQNKDNGVSVFMHRLGVAYTKYFNEKYERVGSLFQGAYKVRHVNRNNYLDYLFYYILANPIELIDSEWKKGKIKDFDEASNFLKSYKWSSYKDFTGEKNFPFLVDFNLIKEFFGEIKDFNKFIKELIPGKFIADYQKLTLE